MIGGKGSDWIPSVCGCDIAIDRRVYYLFSLRLENGDRKMIHAQRKRRYPRHKNVQPRTKQRALQITCKTIRARLATSVEAPTPAHHTHTVASIWMQSDDKSTACTRMRCRGRSLVHFEADDGAIEGHQVSFFDKTFKPNF